ncbi:outer membrane protein assembly factor BamE [Aromatoleum evansii]|uniref:outer membrane protein assembly factor BamE domain-containing protein n=1 Tax=Aromatoleum evansii TaxID=59406 RepID=UPI00388E39AD
MRQVAAQVKSRRVGRRIATLLAAAALVAGCAQTGGFRPVASEAEAIAVHGEPARRWHNEDGTRTLEYPTQPFGHVTLMVTVDAAGSVLRQENALSFENLARIERGMTREQVSRLLGTHRSVEIFRLSGAEVWDWNIENDGPGIYTYFNVHFIDGKVVRTSRTYIFPHDGPEMGGRSGVFPFPAFPRHLVSAS